MPDQKNSNGQGNMAGDADDFGIDPDQSDGLGTGELDLGLGSEGEGDGQEGNADGVPTDDNTDEGDELIAGKYKTVQEMADALEAQEQENANLKRQVGDKRKQEAMDQQQQRQDAIDAQLGQVRETLGTNLDPETVKAIELLTDLKAGKVVDERTAPLERTAYSVNARLELQELASQYGEQFQTLLPTAQKYYEDNPMLGLGNAFKIAFADQVSTQSRTDTNKQEQVDDKRQAHTKTSNARSRQQRSEAEALFDLVKNSGRARHNAKEAAELGIS